MSPVRELMSDADHVALEAAVAAGHTPSLIGAGLLPYAQAVALDSSRWSRTAATMAMLNGALKPKFPRGDR